MYDTLIIGAGMSGLAAGVRLAYYDQRVCVLERHYTIGGLNSFYRLRKRDFDVGLHAVTNYVPKGTRKGPLARLLKQLRFQWEEFALRPQLGSQIAFPGVRLRFGNELELLESEMARQFPAEKDNFQALLGKIIEYDDLSQETFAVSAREVLRETIRDPLLIEMLLCPLMWYGSARERDMDFGQFSILFRSIFLEGLARPLAGVRLILRKLVQKYRALGGELRLRAGVEKIVFDGDRATGVVLENGEQIEARRIISSAGWLETMRLCQNEQVVEVDTRRAGQLSFVESIAVLDRQPQELGCNNTIVFYNDSEIFHWEKPDALCDVRTGVVCSPNNYAYTDAEGQLADGFMRITSLANFDRWQALSEEQYRLEKVRWYDRAVASAVRFVPDFREAVIDTDTFTPTTIRRFTWHDNGAVYGSPQKQLDGATPLKNLYICGTDQGFIGIIGAMVGGISIANKCLLPSA